MDKSVIFTPQTLGALALSAVVAYLLGSISFAVIFSRLFAKDDVRNHGSGNAGATNVFRSIGVLPGLLTFVCDFGKGALAILCSRLLLDMTGLSGSNGANLPLIYVAASLAGLFAMIGHLYPVFFNFRGGKGVMTLAGIVCILSPVRFLVLFGLFLIIFAITRTVSIGSISVVTLYPILTFIECYFIERVQQPELYTVTYVVTQVVVAVFFAAIVVVQHRSNIKRMMNGTEPKLVIKRKERPNTRQIDAGSRVK